MCSCKNSHMKTGHRNMRCGLCFYEFNVTPMSHVYTLDKKDYMQDGMITSYCNKIPKCYVRKISRLSLYMQIKHNHENKQKCQCDLSSVKWSVLFCFSNQLQPESKMYRFSLCLYIFLFFKYIYTAWHIQLYTVGPCTTLTIWTVILLPTLIIKRMSWLYFVSIRNVHHGHFNVIWYNEY